MNQGIVMFALDTKIHCVLVRMFGLGGGRSLINMRTHVLGDKTMRRGFCIATIMICGGVH